MRKFLLLVVCFVLLVGCSKKNVSDKLYARLDAKETYEKALDYFNENVTYYMAQEEVKYAEGSSKFLLEQFRESDHNNQIYSYDTYEKDSLNSCYSSVIKGDKVFEIAAGTQVTNSNEVKSINNTFKSSATNEGLAEYKVKQIQGEFLKSFLYEGEGIDVDIFEIKRTEDDKDIIIEIKLSITRTYIPFDENGQSTEKEERDVVYNNLKVYIQSDGLIYKQEIEKYKDKEFSDRISTTIGVYKDFNKKKNFDYDEEVNKLKKLEGKSIQEVGERLKF